MNDEQMIWEAYKKQKVQISPIKEELINLLEGFRHFKRMIHNYLSFYEKTLNVRRRNYSEEGQPITPEEKNDALIFRDEYLVNFQDDIENITEDNYEDKVWMAHEELTNNLYYDSLERLKKLGLTEDHAKQLIEEYCLGMDTDDEYTKHGIEKIMNADL